MTFPLFELHIPATIGEAIALSRRFNGECAYLAGGTDLLCNSREDLNCKRHLIALSKIAALGDLTESSIGAGVTIAKLVRSGSLLPPVIGEAARLIAGPALREAATVGGNLLLSGRCVYFNRTQLYRCAQGACMKAEGEQCLAVPQPERCYAPFSGDLAPVLLALGAGFVLSGPSGERVVPAASFYLRDGIRANVLGDFELLARVTLPPDVRDYKASYLKLRPRSSIDFPEAGVAVAVKRSGKGKVVHLRVAIGALGPAPSVIALDTGEIASNSWQQLSEKVWKELSPSVLAVRNTSFTPTYRREMARLFVDRLLKELLG